MTTQNMIDNANKPKIKAPDDFSDLLGQVNSPQQFINIAGEPSPAVLAGLLGVNVSLIYQYRQDGKLPPNSGASYRDCIKHYITFLKRTIDGKASSSAEAGAIQKIKLDAARTEQTWVQIRKDRGELVATKNLAIIYEPYFQQMQMQLCSIGRKHPEMQEDIDKLLEEWNQLGKRIEAEGKAKLDTFIAEKMTESVVDDADTEVL